MACGSRRQETEILHGAMMILQMIPRVLLDILAAILLLPQGGSRTKGTDVALRLRRNDYGHSRYEENNGAMITC